MQATSGCSVRLHILTPGPLFIHPMNGSGLVFSNSQPVEA